MVDQLCAGETTLRGGQLDWPQEVGDSLELLTNSVDLVDNILNALETLVAEGGLNNGVGADRHSLARHLAETSLVDDVLHGLKAGVTVSDERLNQSEHFGGGGIDAHEDTTVQLSKSQKLKDLGNLRRNTNDTTDTDDEDQFLLRINVNLVVRFGDSSVVNGSLSKL